MITFDPVYFQVGRYRSTFNHDGSPMTREVAQAAIRDNSVVGRAILVSVAYCRVCGDDLGVLSPSLMANSAGWRCDRHKMRNPCAIEGCKRSTQGRGGWHGLALWLCPTHWRLGVPPRSPERRVYHRLFKAAKRCGGWNDAINRRFWRVWPRLVAIARARVAGDIDEAEIKRLFGWD